MAHRIAIVTCSTRNPRLNPFISNHVHAVLSNSPVTTTATTKPVALEVLDIETFNLPLLDEPGIPAHFPAADPTPHYAHAHTRAWSSAVRSFDAFIFVTPQYNWSVPAALKNALDYLFHEWVGKPTGIISYGGHGGGKSAAHLRDILNGLRTKAVEPHVELVKGDVDIAKCVELGVLEPRIADMWRAEGKEEMFGRLLGGVVGALEAKAEN